MADRVARIPVQSGSFDSPSEASNADRQLEALALDYGIEPSFTDAHGNVRLTPAAVQRALLEAMGVPIRTSADAQAARHARSRSMWETALPPVVVAEAAKLQVPLVCATGTDTIAWRLTLEDGGVHAGTASFSALPLADETPDAPAGREMRLLRLPDLPPGYHELSIAGFDARARVIVTPGTCWLPDAVTAGERLSGIALQLYLLKSANNWGIGDFGDLRAVAERWAARGIDVVGLNPLHALFADDPEHASPYSPESRLLLNALNIDVTAIPEFGASADLQARCADPQFRAALADCREAQLVAYSTVAQLKRDMLRATFAQFTAHDSERRRAFEQFRDGAGTTLRRTFLFVALREHFAHQDPELAAWQRWPGEFREHASPAVAAFAREHVSDIEFIAWLQWVADDQLGAAARAASSMRVGLYRDLAVGADPGGAETWCNPQAVVDAARVGAPPDIYNPQGQNWDLPPFDPQALRAEAYASFVELVRANMRHAGGLRIDHVMALQHLYWIPRGATPDAGAYVGYPLDDLVGIIALESHRARCLVVGEDLGTVPAGFRERMTAANILSYRVLFFERDGPVNFAAPQAYPRGALAVLGSHDLPTLRAWWNGSDVRLRQRLGLFSNDDAADEQLQARAGERDSLTRALRRADVLADGQALSAETLFTAAHAFLARTSAALAVAQLDDITDETDPVNVPTTSDEHPNWRRRLSRSIEELEAAPRLENLFAIFGAAGRLREPGAADGSPEQRT